MRHTKWAARFVLALRSEMSIKATARFTGMHWETVKNIEKAWLKKKYKKIRLGQVEYLGVDEVYMGKVIRCLKQMAKTIRRRLDGLLAYWKHAKLTSASQEGFNNKIESA